MLCFIYKSLKTDGFYLYINKKDDFSDVPETLFSKFGDPAFIMELDITLQTKLAREDSANVLKHVEEHGYFFQIPPVRMAMPDLMQ